MISLRVSPPGVNWPRLAKTKVSLERARLYLSFGIFFGIRASHASQAVNFESFSVVPGLDLHGVWLKWCLLTLQMRQFKKRQPFSIAATLI